MSDAPRIAIVGAGILGMSVAHRLASSGCRVTVYERSADLGGLVGTFDFDGYPVDRFYHVVLPTDDRVRSLATELGTGEDAFRFRHTRVGFFDPSGRTSSMSSALELARFPVLRPRDRARLALFAARARMRGTRERLDRTELLDWLRREAGSAVVERLWRPLLDSKFAGRYEDLPATYIWSRMRRMSGTRDRRGREVMGWMIGGYPVLIEALRRRIVSLGGVVSPSTTVEAVVGDGNGIRGVVVDGALRPADLVVSTLLPPAAERLLPSDARRRMGPDRDRYLGVVCVLLRIDSTVSPFHTLSILDRSIPLTTVVETTHVVDPAAVGGSILYLARYVDPADRDLSRPADDVADEYTRQAARMFPELASRRILARSVQRSAVVEPVRTLDGAAGPSRDPGIPGLVMASSADAYPDVVNAEAMLGVAERTSGRALDFLAGRPEVQRVAA